MKKNIIVSLDGITKEKAVKIARSLSGMVWGFKVNDLLLGCGTGIIFELKKYGKVFADPKLCDTPETVANSVKRLAKAGVDFITIHGSCGFETVKTAVNSAKNKKIFVVTILTSLDEEQTFSIFGKNIEKTLLQSCDIAKKSGAAGIICSGKELKIIKKHPELKKLAVITPGIRPAWYKSSDCQKRKMTPKEAVGLGTDFLVIGRPILKSKNPKMAVEKIIKEII